MDLRQWDSPVDNQGKLGSCEANAIVNAFELMTKHLYPEKFVELSRLFLYYNSRSLVNAVDKDVGAYLRDGMAAGSKYGICTEKLWTYDIGKFTVKPTVDAYIDGQSRKIVSYKLLKSISDIIDSLNDNKPVVIGIIVYPSFDSTDIDIPVVPMPSDEEIATSGGGHAVAVVGYDMGREQLLIKNSYGTEWGDLGYGWLPFDYYKTQGVEAWVFDISIK